MAHPIHDRRYRQLAALLMETRKQRGLLQQDLAERLGRPQSFVSKYESGARRIDVIELLDILRALEADPHEFIDRIRNLPLAALPR
ncbi:Xre family transcriptional regulator [Trinickia symbiotica]|uniref:XRE family transcriptional regulator n=1 Tax=Trinickia symbiotica TaxID=863227 RepID=A0A2N7WPA0_9BURK|nr:helix-turn-helix transcriptional regulator [Trinickia symbiotica]PMS31267.1 XRE family transcriptional regulator [Trinickia symbiotica]PPK41704.1 Xre family transcriptional regulator [Trinickia symbiotica]PTB16978.1 XRE family transcriptional regulator [Trinickia symbiotica]